MCTCAIGRIGYNVCEGVNGGDALSSILCLSACVNVRFYSKSGRAESTVGPTTTKTGRAMARLAPPVPTPMV